MANFSVQIGRVWMPSCGIARAWPAQTLDTVISTNIIDWSNFKKLFPNLQVEYLRERKFVVLVCSPALDELFGCHFGIAVRSGFYVKRQVPFRNLIEDFQSLQPQGVALRL